jgi:8-oxo-dGTP diphosphatase
MLQHGLCCSRASRGSHPFACRTAQLVRRKNPPLGVALPGGFVDVGESVPAAAARELQEETSTSCAHPLRELRTYSDPGRDPRRHTVSVVFLCESLTGTPRAGDDAKELLLAPLSEVETLPFAFDHRTIVLDWLAARKAT